MSARESIDRHYAQASGATSAAYKQYKGIPMLCEEGLHEEVAATAQRLLAAGASVIDVGCGQGAFALRLHDLGFKVDACDLYDHCKCKDAVRFQQVSAEEARFDRLYDAVFMLEMLEHVESPFAVVRQYAKLVKPGGLLLLSTPNVDADWSRALFLLKGRHWYFEDAGVKQDGHINPLHEFQVRYLAGELGLTLLEHRNLLENRHAAPGALWGLMQILRALQRAGRSKRNDGKIALYVLRKP